MSSTTSHTATAGIDDVEIESEPLHQGSKPDSHRVNQAGKKAQDQPTSVLPVHAAGVHQATVFAVVGDDPRRIIAFSDETCGLKPKNRDMVNS